MVLQRMVYMFLLNLLLYHSLCHMFYHYLCNLRLLVAHNHYQHYLLHQVLELRLHWLGSLLPLYLLCLVVWSMSYDILVLSNLQTHLVLYNLHYHLPCNLRSLHCILQSITLQLKNIAILGWKITCFSCSYSLLSPFFWTI